MCEFEHDWICLDDGTTDLCLAPDVRIIVFDELLVTRVPVLVDVRRDCPCPNEQGAKETEEGKDAENSFVPTHYRIRIEPPTC
jgi:hypothetical protein